MLIRNVKLIELDTPNENNILLSTLEAYKYVNSRKRYERVRLCEFSLPAEVRFIQSCDIANVSHSMFNLRIDGKFLMCDVKVFDTRFGRIMKELIDDDIKSSIRPTFFSINEKCGNLYIIKDIEDISCYLSI